MSQKTVIAHVYGRDYTLACDAGQEQHLAALVQQINGRTERLDKAVGKLPEAMMLLYTALMVADELHDVSRENTRLKEDLARMQQLVNENGDDARIRAMEGEMAQSLQAFAGRLDGLADKLAS